MHFLKVPGKHWRESQRGGDVQALRVCGRAGDGDRGALGKKHLRTEDAHGAGADHQRRVAGRGDGWIAQALRHAAQWLVQCAGVLAHRLVHLVEVALWHQHVGGETTVDVRPDGAARGAQVAPTGSTSITGVAGVEVGLGRHALAHPGLCAGAGLDDTAGDLVAHDHRWDAGELVVLDVQVGAADAGREDLDDDLIADQRWVAGLYPARRSQAPWHA